jgi:hypothetical protein
MRIGSAVRWLAALILTVCASLLAAQSFDLDRDREPVISLDALSSGGLAQGARSSIKWTGGKALGAARIRRHQLASVAQ